MPRSGSTTTTLTEAAGAATTNASKRQRQYYAGLLLAVGWIGSVALLVGAVVAFYLQKNKLDHSIEESPAVNLELEQQKWKDLRDTVLVTFAPLDDKLATELNNPASAEWQALQWMSLKDNVNRHGSISQRYAMAVIWTYFGIEMSPQLHECQWHSGVACRDQEVVIGLNFTGFPAFDHLTLPRSLAYLPSLESLDLSRHGLQGSISVPCFKHWTKLQVLDLEENSLTSIFGGLEDDSWPEMMRLNAQNNLLSETVPSALSKMTNLRELYLKGNTDLTGPLMEYVVPNLSRIENVVISRTGIGGSIPDLVDNDSLRNLKELDTAFTDLSGSLPESLSVASDLVNLQLGGPRALWTGTLPSSYDKLTRLEFVSFKDMRGLTGTLPASWGESWSNLYSFDLWGTPNLQGTLPPEWSGMTDLELLRLMDNQLTSTIPTEFGKLTNLKILTLNKSRLTGTMPLEVCKLRSSLQLNEISVDCKLASHDSSRFAAVECPYPDCCTFCSVPWENLDDDGV